MARKKKGVGNRQQYTQDQKIAAVHTLQESANANVEGRPNFLRCEKVTRISRGSLKNWWKAYKDGKFAGMLERATGRPELSLPPPPVSIADITQAEYAEWRAQVCQVLMEYAVEVGNFTVAAPLDKRMAEHMLVVMAEREKARPALDRVEKLYERCVATGLVE